MYIIKINIGDKFNKMNIYAYIMVNASMTNKYSSYSSKTACLQKLLTNYYSIRNIVINLPLTYNILPINDEQPSLGGFFSAVVRPHELNFSNANRIGEHSFIADGDPIAGTIVVLFS